MKKKIKKMVHRLLSYRTKKVIDVKTNRPELATYWKLFGFVVKTTYKPLDECHHSQFLGIN